ncbi:MAG: ExbD/TolR family protein [Leptolyngbya sp. IPPAS B-1204]|uniref:Biopolymer transporter ExbD n=1 Tax=Leptolyngbya sp. NK1-12 TaxID=2547451 RepID=A0AA96WE44_9CYAN|nr:biopolymer transporter ExbD [Leptolyngbya sp. NK1-12]MBF2047039.1 biopolymer transporter ExbD [Elainella sp. C42_A2020_010]RNJ70465.1 MAG: biopolymer transporter ExbD [Leptolyngbya sp. IPPAS B-1204]WNZ23424.1 biopolymer transporter ExbD [Leptolyngbya sp. NK1-12]
MRFKRQRRGSDIPTVNLVPMLDVLMVVLTFFIIVSMTLTLQQGVEVQLPSQDTPTPVEPEPKIAIVELNPEGEILFDDQPTEKTALTAAVKAFLEENPKGIVVLQAAEKLPYEQVVTLLGEMKAVGGERVSLAIE